MPTPKEFDVSGMTVIVTGASRGIGLGIVNVLAKAGANVMVTALTDKYLSVIREQTASAANPVQTLQADATDSTDWERTIDAAMSKWDHIDALVNNLGDAIRKDIVPAPGSTDEQPISDDELRSVIDVNLTEAFKGCRAVGEHFIGRRQGKVLNISGFAALRGQPGLAVYSAAKAGLVRLTQTLALEWAPYGVTVNCIAPGYFPDQVHGDHDEVERRKNWARTAVPLGRVGEVEEVGLLAQYMLSPAAGYMTGETVYIDGGVSFA